MFSALRQGSTVYILEKGNKLSCRTAQVTSVSSPQFSSGMYPANGFGGTINISVDANGEKLDFSGLPTNLSTQTYNNGATIVSESRDAIATEVENMIKNSQSILDNIDYHKSVVLHGEQILASLNPQFAKEQALREEVSGLRGRIDGIDDKLDRLIAAMSSPVNK